MKQFLLAGLLILFCCINAHAQQEAYAYNGTVPIHYRTFGTGNPLLIINGGPGMNSEGFATLAQMLSRNTCAIIYDQRGTGKSIITAPDSTNITMDLMIEDIECLRKHLHIDAWVVLGHSFGGMLASYYATKYPQHITSLILSSSGGVDLALLNDLSNKINARLSKTELDSLSYWNQRIQNNDTTYTAKIGRGRALAPAYIYQRKFIPIIAERLTQGNPRINLLIWQNMSKIGFDCKEKLKAFTKPVLIIQGKQDIIDKKIAVTAQQAFPNAKLVLIDKAVHYGWLDRPDVYLPTVERFILSSYH